MQRLNVKLVVFTISIAAVAAAIAVINVAPPRATAQQASDADWKAVEQALGKAGQMMPGDVYRVIWQPTSRNLFLDAGVRHGISSAAPDWQFTAGLTFGFSVLPARDGSR